MNRAEMLATTRAYLDVNTSILNSVPVINMMKTQLDDILHSISEHQEAKESSQVFLGSNETALKKAMADYGKSPDQITDLGRRTITTWPSPVSRDCTRWLRHKPCERWKISLPRRTNCSPPGWTR